MENKIYRTKIDFRELSDKLVFEFFVSGNLQYYSVNKNCNKTRCYTITYNNTKAVDAVLEVDNNNNSRLFLRFDSSSLTLENHFQNLSISSTDIILEVFKNSNGVFGFEEIKGRSFGAFLSHKNYFNASVGRSVNEGQGAIRHFGKTINGKNHAIQMILPKVQINKNKNSNISFDMDIYMETGGQYTKSLGFKVGIDEKGIIEGNVISIKPVCPIINKPQNITLDNVYINLTSYDLASKEVLYDYKNQLLKQNAEADSLQLISSEVYAVQNNNYNNVSLSSFNLSADNIIEIPYNVSREVDNDGNITASRGVIKHGKKIYPLNWVSEIRDNDFFSSANKCLTLRFSSKEQLLAFTDSLKKQQIGNIEGYLVMNPNGIKEPVKRTYTKISQWVERTTIDQYNDVRFTYDTDLFINTITICPKKKSKIGAKNEGTQNSLYTNDNSYILPGGDYYSGYFHSDPKIGFITGKDKKSPEQILLTPLYQYAPIGKNSSTDFCFSTFNNTTPQYSAFSATSTSENEPNKTYDLHISASSFSAQTVIPISNIVRANNLKLIGDLTENYTPYAFSEVYGENGGSVGFNNSDPDNYMTFSARNSGVYRFTYKAYLDIKYTDTKWCQYVANAYPSAFTTNYPVNDYEIKRLVNSSIIKAGNGETTTVLQDTGFKYNPGVRYKIDNEYDTPDNTGVLDFSFITKIVKTSAGSGATKTILKSFDVLRCEEDGSADDYLTLEVSPNDVTSSGSNVCILSGVSSSTIFHKSILVTVDTGFINLASGDTIQLVYDGNWDTTSKGGYYSLAGETNIVANLGSKLNFSGTPIESPWFRGIRLADEVVDKNLFFDQTKTSKPFKMTNNDVGGVARLNGSLYLSDRKCGNIKPPIIDNDTFKNQVFIDSDGKDQKLIWNIKSNKMTNGWQRLIESNTIKDYILAPQSNGKMTTMKKNGVFCFYLPIHNSEDNPTCIYKFPQLAQSYVIKNVFKNYFGGEVSNYIIVTIDCNFYMPCSRTKILTAYDILHKTTPDKWKLTSDGSKISIGGKEVTIVAGANNKSKPTKFTTQSNKCQYYCKCGQLLAEQLKLDPIYGTSNELTDLEVTNCQGCIEKANNYCKSLHTNCTPVVLGSCKGQNTYLPQVDTGIITKTKGNVPEPIDKGNDSGTRPPSPPPSPPESEGRGGDGEGRGGGGPRGGGVSMGGGGTTITSFEGCPCGNGSVIDRTPETYSIECCERPIVPPVGPPPPPPPELTLYSCVEGICRLSVGGMYKNIEECGKYCKSIIVNEGKPVEPKDPEDEMGKTVIPNDKVETKVGVLAQPIQEVGGICKKGYYWCQEFGKCISDNITCGKINLK